MKSNLPKILFGLFIIGLVIFSIYILYFNKGKEDSSIPQTDIEPQIINDLRLGIAEFDTLNPILSNNKNVQEISKLIYEPLITISKEYKAEGCLASEWSMIDNNAYLIKLRENVKFHDGNKFTAKDVKFTVDKIKDESISSIYKNNLKNVLNVEIIDEYTIKFTLTSNIPFFEYNLTFPILSENYYLNQDFATTSKNQNPVGTGKYKISSHEQEEIVLKKNQNYWNNINKTENNQYGINTVSIFLYSSMGEVYNAFKIGNIDLVYTDNNNFEEYIGTLGYNKKEFKGRQYDFIALNCNSNVLSNLEIRRAISYAIDKSAINSNIYNNKYYTAEFPLDYSNWIYTNQTASSGYNPEQVNTILLENGWNLKNNVWQKTINNTTIRANLTLIVNSTNEQRCLVADNIKEQLSAVGINVTVRKVSNSQYQNYLKNKNYDMILMGTNIGFSPNINTYLGEKNYSNYTNEELKNILLEVYNISDENLLKEKYNRVYEIYRSEIPFISLYFNKNVVCYSSNLMGDISPNCYSIFYNIENWYRQY